MAHLKTYILNDSKFPIVNSYSNLKSVDEKCPEKHTELKGI